MNDTFRVEIDYGKCETRTSGSFVWKRNPLGRVNQGILRSVGFLYRCREGAETGIGKSATAFVVSVPSEEAGRAEVKVELPTGLCHSYITTASHVVLDEYTVLRIIHLDGSARILELPKQIRNTYEPHGDAWI